MQHFHLKKEKKPKQTDTKIVPLSHYSQPTQSAYAYSSNETLPSASAVSFLSYFALFWTLLGCNLC